jgi:dTDP-4-amino-4,6-dideoxygalactose transaminase
MRYLPYGRQSIVEDDIRAVVETLGSDWLTQGPTVDRFEEALAERCSALHAVVFSSGTAALHAACAVAGLGEGDELLTSAFSFAASANCARYVGASPDFVDIDAATLGS